MMVAYASPKSEKLSYEGTGLDGLCFIKDQIKKDFHSKGDVRFHQSQGKSFFICMYYEIISFPIMIGTSSPIAPYFNMIGHAISLSKASTLSTSLKLASSSLLQ